MNFDLNLYLKKWKDYFSGNQDLSLNVFDSNESNISLKEKNRISSFNCDIMACDLLKTHQKHTIGIDIAYG